VQEGIHWYSAYVTYQMKANSVQEQTSCLLSCLVPPKWHH